MTHIKNPILSMLSDLRRVQLARREHELERAHFALKKLQERRKEDEAGDKGRTAIATKP